MYLNGVALEYIDSVKYLGVMLSNDMKDDADMNRHTVFDLISGLSAYVILGPKNRPN